MWTNCAYCGKKLTIVEGEKGFLGYCDEICVKNEKEGKTTSTTYIDDDTVWNGVYEHITTEPIHITGGRKELMEVCRKYGVLAKGLLKPKSQGKGYEMQSKRFK